MTTLLQFVMAKYLGEPDRIAVSNQWFWECPVCGHESFHTLPHKAEYRDRYHCFRCGLRGDVLDFLLLQHPQSSYGDRLERLAALRAEYEALPESERVIARGGGKHGAQLLWSLVEQGRVSHEDLLEVVAELNHEESMRRERIRARVRQMTDAELVDVLKRAGKWAEWMDGNDDELMAVVEAVDQADKKGGNGAATGNGRE